MTLRYGSVCSGIEAATVAWHALGWEPAFFSEIEAFPRAVLAHHYPEVPCHGDFTSIRAGEYGPVDLLVGGTPCQSFSVGGGRLGLDDPRGNLAIEYVALAKRLDVTWFLFENVPGLLSSDRGRDFGALLGIMGECGYGVAYRVLDARGFNHSDQPRPRLFVVGYRGDWRRAAAVLFDGPGVAWDLAEKASAAPVLTRKGAMALDDRTPCILVDGRARIATPVEHERAFGFPDNYTLVPYRGRLAADGPRFKSLGNSMDVHVVRWIGQRIAMVEALSSISEAAE